MNSKTNNLNNISTKNNNVNYQNDLLLLIMKKRISVKT